MHYRCRRHGNGTRFTCLRLAGNVVFSVYTGGRTVCEHHLSGWHHLDDRIHHNFMFSTTGNHALGLSEPSRWLLWWWQSEYANAFCGHFQLLKAIKSVIDAVYLFKDLLNALMAIIMFWQAIRRSSSAVSKPGNKQINKDKERKKNAKEQQTNKQQLAGDD